MTRRPSLERPPAPNPKRSDSVAIVEAVATAARELAAQGLQEISMRAVARRAGVGEASLYRYFPTKGALFAEVFRRQHEFIVDQVERALVDATSLEGGIEAAIGAFLDVGDDELRIRRCLNFDVPPTWTLQELTAYTDRLRDILVRWACHHSPGAPKRDVEHQVFYVVGMLRGVLHLRMLQPDRAPPIEEQRNVLNRMVKLIAAGQLTQSAHASE